MIIKQRSRTHLIGLGIIALLGPLSSHAQQLDPSLIDSNSPKQKQLGQIKIGGNDTHWAVEISFGANLWDPSEGNTSESQVRQAIERFYFHFTPTELTNALSDMNYQGVLGNFNYYSDNSAYLKPRLIRLRYRPTEFDRVSFSLGFGRTPAVFYATALQTATGEAIAMNQTEAIAGNYVDQYFHLRELYENWLLERPGVPELWTCLLIEAGASYQATDLVKFHAALGVVPGGLKGANQWKSSIQDDAITSSTGDFQQVNVAQQFTIGSTLCLGAITTGLEYRSSFFIKETSSFERLGASLQRPPGFVSLCLGFAW
ncbi:MAG: hypothetical protein HOH92_07835 [Crocinitomicaceae bacterium]|jgi:hypothetical protein|nr:hypothetical protein [Crocinitomicaceae bacterium]